MFSPIFLLFVLISCKKVTNLRFYVKVTNFKTMCFQVTEFKMASKLEDFIFQKFAVSKNDSQTGSNTTYDRIDIFFDATMLRCYAMLQCYDATMLCYDVMIRCYDGYDATMLQCYDGYDAMIRCYGGYDATM